MKKLFAVIAVVLSVAGVFTYRAMALNFSGQQTLNGLSGASTLSAGLVPTLIFGAPVTGVYFVNGQLTLPQLPTGGNAPSQVVATVATANTTCGASTVVYTGIAGATGFQVNQISVNGGSTVCVWLTSGAAVDQGLNVVRGTVAFGNTF